MKTRVGIAIAAGLVVVAGCGASGLETGAGTVESKTASAFLITAETDWHQKVDTERNKNIEPSARCYYVTGADGKQSLGTVACGPLRRLGSPERSVWDIVKIDTTPGEKPGLKLPDEVQWQQSQLRPASSTLWRPDDKKADDNADALAAPPAPPAEAGLARVTDGGQKLDLKPATGKLVVPDGTVTLKGLANPETIGGAADVMGPASGEKFIAAEFTTAPTLNAISGEPGFGSGSKSTPATKWTVTVGTEQRPVEMFRPEEKGTSTARTLLVSVPKDATDVSLTATSGSVVQKVSLITGERTTTDVATTYYRTDLSADLNKSFPATRREVKPYFNATYALNIDKAGLSPWDSDRGWAPAGKAWFVARWTGNLDYNYILYDVTWAPQSVTATADGAAVPGIKVTHTDDDIAFLVPADTKAVQLNVSSVLKFSANDPAAKPTSGSVAFPPLTATATFQ
ncbi:hypothetical protein E1263_36290 [Kribbella antibiotica]|uniref:Large secreted protein n=1 Tax=Kribbella antibiotica TaxID=190195 RepID=A0A4R4YPP2_9ACTN|nr:hypothetical protein [Kribbella antibiotica]TDD46540.1 hypothetical protein E1263_36290 [Kribbella antibiotica]